MADNERDYDDDDEQIIDWLLDQSEDDELSPDTPIEQQAASSLRYR